MAGRDDDADSIDGVDLALALAHGSPEARALIEKQSLLIDAQETLARADLQHRGWQIIGERVGSLIKGLTALVGILVLLGIASFLWSASRVSGMVVDAFAVPPAYAQQGLNGTVVAKQLLDKVAMLEAGAQSARAKSSYENSLSDSKGVVVPYAGVSLGELRREARDWLGSETHLTGEIVQLPGNRLSLSFRTTNGLSGQGEASDREPEKLLDAAALAMFKETQPYRYAVYQSRQGNRPEAIATLSKLARSEDIHERLWALHGLALDASTQAETIAIYNHVLALRPDFLSAVGNMALYAATDGHEEEGYRLGQRAAAAYAKGAPDYTPSYSEGFGLDARIRVAAMKDDLAEAARQAEAAERTQGGGPTFLAYRPFQTAGAWADAHNFARARNALAAAGFLDPARRAAAEKIAGAQLDLAGLYAVASGDSAGQVLAYQRMLGALKVQSLSQISLGEASDADAEVARISLLMALPLARLGRIDEARSALAGQNGTNDQVLRTRAFLTAYAGDAPTSDRLFAAAAARTPSLPGANLLWAEALLRRGDAVRAEAQAREALRRGPNSAQGERLLGDALSEQRRWDDAERAYAAAARLAPQWGSLQMRWASALWRLGKRDDARTKLRAAASMALSDFDRRHLAQMGHAATL